MKFIPKNAFSVKNSTVDIMQMYLDSRAVRMVAGGGAPWGSTLWSRHGCPAAQSSLDTPLAVVSPRGLAAGVPSCGATSHRVLDISSPWTLSACAIPSAWTDCCPSVNALRRPLCCDAIHRPLDRRKCPVSLSLRPSGFAPRIK